MVVSAVGLHDYAPYTLTQSLIEGLKLSISVVYASTQLARYAIICKKEEVTNESGNERIER